MTTSTHRHLQRATSLGVLSAWLLLATAGCASTAGTQARRPAPSSSAHTSIAYRPPTPAPRPRAPGTPTRGTAVAPRPTARPTPTPTAAGTGATTLARTFAKDAAVGGDARTMDTAPFIYRFRAGDEVGIGVWQEKDLSGVQRVLRDGTISPPLLEPMRIEGFTIKEVRKKLIAKYREYLKEPRITVRVASVQSDRMFILGEVTTPKAVPIFGPMTLMQGIAEAGGFLEEFADKKTIRIVRQVRDGPSRIITINAERVLQGHRRDLPMRAGDIVFVHPTGLTNWSREFSQALDPIAGLLGAAGDAAAIALIAR